MLLDSTFLNDLVRNDPDADAKLEALIGDETPVAISSLTAFEVGIGLRGDAQRHYTKFERVVDQINEVPFGPQEARHALEIQHNLHDRGEPTGAVDVLIAGTAATRPDATVLTRNVDEFERVDAITVETYWWLTALLADWYPDPADKPDHDPEEALDWLFQTTCRYIQLFVSHASDASLSGFARVRLNMKQITLRHPEDTLESLEDAAEDAGRTRSEHIRSVIESREDADEVRAEYEQKVDELRSEHEEEEVKELRRDAERLRNEKQALIADREEKRELVRYVKQEKSLTERKAQAGLVTRARWFLSGMPAEGE